jgi:hypothetical protein
MLCLSTPPPWFGFGGGRVHVPEYMVQTLIHTPQPSMCSHHITTEEQRLGIIAIVVLRFQPRADRCLHIRRLAACDPAARPPRFRVGTHGGD